MLTEVSVKVLVILSKKSIGGSIGNTFQMKYLYLYWQYFLKVLIVNNPDQDYIYTPDIINKLSSAISKKSLSCYDKLHSLNYSILVAKTELTNSVFIPILVHC